MTALDTAQSRVVRGAPSRWCVVIAGPGSGKTTVSVELISHLNDVVPDPEQRTVLYVSFSRATLKAAFKGARQVAERSDISVDLRTLDSLALYILGETASDQEGAQPNFERRISEASRILKNQGEELLDDVCHVIVDEAQDLSSSRREFLIQLLKKVPDDCGLTLFADPAQAIYQFQESTSGGFEQRSLDFNFTNAWIDFLKELESIRPLHREILDGQYRAETSTMRLVADRLSQSRNVDGAIADSSVLDAIQSDLPVLTLDQIPAMAGIWRGTTAILTRTNAEALQIFTSLGSSLQLEIIVPKTDRPRIPAWLSHWESYSDAAGDAFSIQDLFSQSTNLPRFYEDEARQLGLHPEDFGKVLWSDIAKRSQYFSPSPIDLGGGQRLVVSTIHQAKGLEYDNVVIYNPERLISPGPRMPAQKEMLFVALSRASSRLVSLEKSDAVRPTRDVRGRLIIQLSHRLSPAYVKVGPSDVRNDILVGDGASQALLRDSDRSSWVHFNLLDGSTDVPVYRILLEGTPVGITTQSFGAEIKALTKSSHGRWPQLGPVLIDGTESAVSYRWNRGRPFLIPRPLGFSAISY